MRKTAKKLLSAVLSTAMIVTSFTAIGAANDTKTASAAESAVWGQDGYHAYLYYQTTKWDYRNAYKDGKKYSDKDSYAYIQANGQDASKTAEVKDVLLNEGDGEYTVKLSGVDLRQADSFNMMGVATDIPVKNGTDIKVTNATLKVDGNEVEGAKDIELPYIKTESYYQFNVTGYGDWPLSGTIPFKQGSLTSMPKSDIEITFKVSGVPKYVKTYGKKLGVTFTNGNIVYKVTQEATEDTAGKVKVNKLSSKGKTAKNISAPDTVKTAGASYTVTALNSNVFKAAKASSVTLGKNIKKIPASAFANCKNLNKLVLNAKLTSVAKNAFKGCAKKISVSGSSTASNVKKIKTSGYKNLKAVYTPFFNVKACAAKLYAGKSDEITIAVENVKSISKVTWKSSDESVLAVKGAKVSSFKYAGDVSATNPGSAKITAKVTYKTMAGKTASKTFTYSVKVLKNDDLGYTGSLDQKDITLRVKIPETASNVGDAKTVTIKGGTSDSITVKDNGTVRKDLSTQWLIENEMGEGVNLGNTMEATLGTYADKIAATDAKAFEQAWGQPVTTEKYIQSLRSYGFNTIRIPVAWSNMDSEDGTYTINEKYLGRVEEIVNYALNCGMYVIINDHWDNQWWGQFGACKEDADGNKTADETRRAEAWKRYERYWTQICDRFKDYSDHLIFEGANEELGDRLNDAIYESGYAAPKDVNDTKAISGNLTLDERYEMVNKINQKFVDIVRASDGNNAYRHLLIAGYDTNIDKTCDDRFKMPTDTAENGTTKLSISIHYYTPWAFCGDGGEGVYTPKDKEATETFLAEMDKFYNAGYGIIMGEFSVCNPKQEGVAQWLNDTMTIAANHHILPVLWETNQYMDKDKCQMRYHDIAELYNTITGSNGSMKSNLNTNGTTADGTEADKLEAVDVSSYKAGWTWTGKWYKNDGSSLVGDNRYDSEGAGEKVTGGDLSKYVPENTATSSINGDATEIGFNDYGYQAFLKIDLSKYKKPVLKFDFLDKSDSEDNVGSVTFAATDKVDGRPGTSVDMKYAEYSGKGIMLTDTLINELKTNPYLYITFANRPTVTGITVYEGE